MKLLKVRFSLENTWVKVTPRSRQRKFSIVFIDTNTFHTRQLPIQHYVINFVSDLWQVSGLTWFHISLSCRVGCFIVFNAAFNTNYVIAWWSDLLVEKPEYPEKTRNLSQVTDKLDHIMLYRQLELNKNVLLLYFHLMWRRVQDDMCSTVAVDIYHVTEIMKISFTCLCSIAWYTIIVIYWG
jgi:hypothetical protein